MKIRPEVLDSVTSNLIDEYKHRFEGTKMELNTLYAVRDTFLRLWQNEVMLGNMRQDDIPPLYVASCVHAPSRMVCDAALSTPSDRPFTEFLGVYSNLYYLWHFLGSCFVTDRNGVLDPCPLNEVLVEANQRHNHRLKVTWKQPSYGGPRPRPEWCPLKEIEK